MSTQATRELNGMSPSGLATPQGYVPSISNVGTGVVSQAAPSESQASPRSIPANPIAILGIPFDNITTKQALELIDEMVSSRRSHYLVTANVDFLVQAREDVELRRIFLDADLVLCDGTPLVWASRLLGNPLPERVAGADLVPLLLALAAKKRYRVFFLGATPESAKAAIDKLRTTYPELIIAGHHSPPFKPLLEMDHEDIKQRILDAKPDLLFVCFGCPKQEKWIAMHYRTLAVPVSVGVGGTLDFLSGQCKRAPLWMQRCGTEWIFRLAQEPRRLFRRYVKDLWVFGWSILAQWWSLQLRRPGARPGPCRHALRVAPDLQCIPLPERLDLTVVKKGELNAQIVADPRHCVLNLEHTTFIDSTGVAWLIMMRRQLQAAERQLVLLSAGHNLRRTLRQMRLEEFFTLAEDLPSARRLIETRTHKHGTVIASQNTPSPSPLLWSGEITAANANVVWQVTRDYLASLMNREILIDLSDVPFIDSTGLEVMLRLKDFAAQQSKCLLFTGLQPLVKNVLSVARVEKVLVTE